MLLGAFTPIVAFTVSADIGTKSLNLNIDSISVSIWFQLNPVGATSHDAFARGYAGTHFFEA